MPSRKSSSVRPPKSSSWIARALSVLHDWAETGWAASATAAWGLLQGAIVPGPSEALLVPLGLSDPPRAMRLAMAASAGAIVGGAIAYWIGSGAIQAAAVPLDWLGVGPDELARLRPRFDRWGWWLILASTMSPLSTKVVCIAAGMLGFPFWGFAGALALGRTLRFSAVGALLRIYGARFGAWLTREPVKTGA